VYLLGAGGGGALSDDLETETNFISVTNSMVQGSCWEADSRSAG